MIGCYVLATVGLMLVSWGLGWAAHAHEITADAEVELKAYLRGYATGRGDAQCR